MFRRGIATWQVEETIRYGEVIKDYPQDKPYPSRLLLYFVNATAVHVVVSQDITSGICFIVTAYFPDPVMWTPDFKNKI